MAKKRAVSKETFERNGKKLGSTHIYADGTTRTFLNPSGKGSKYAKELKDGVRYTNEGFQKRDEYGMPSELTDTQAAYRSGYLDAQKDSAAVYKKKHGGA